MILMLVKILIWVMFVLLAFVTIAPLVKTEFWWVRGWDFPRVHIAILSILCLCLAGFLAPWGSWLMVASCAIFAVYQTSQVLPYTPLYNTEVPLTRQGEAQNAFSIMSINVLKENENHTPLLDLIQDQKPDILFLMETDDAWSASLKSHLQSYKFHTRHPHPDHYGMIFATNLEVLSSEFRFLSDDDTPTLLATLISPDGHKFNFIGLHPKPPVPGVNTAERDAQIAKSATISHHMNHPVISMGDFNDVAWSRTSKLFKKRGDYRDPRIGRGLYSSFDAQHPIMRFPIDQLYVTKGVGLVSFGRGPKIGSDHFPMTATAFIQTDAP